MTDIENIKHLIAEGKTKEAIDSFQALLDGSNREELNQLLLLKSQYNDEMKKMQLGLMDASTNLSRINFALLTLCDQVQKVDIKHDISNDKTLYSDEDKNHHSITKPLILFAILVILALGIVFFLIKDLI
jgi:hypothetical protein